jgi:hypothetical protein
MNGKDWLEVVANIASIVTAIVVAAAWISYQLALREKRTALVDYLKREKNKKVDKGQRSVLHLMKNLAMPKDDVLKAAFDSKHIVPRVTEDPRGFADSLLFEYTETPRSKKGM